MSRTALVLFTLLNLSDGFIRTLPSKRGSTAMQALSEKEMAKDEDFDRLMKAVAREYTSFFDPLEEEFYLPNVEFIDPFNSFTGLDKYRNNIDMLAGRTPLGMLTFERSGTGITLHKIERLGAQRMRTRWTLRMQPKFIPWKPIVRFTGISEYTLEGGRIKKQEDFWDSIDLQETSDGTELYERSGTKMALRDFIFQLFSEDKTPGVSSQELPYELLRRSDGYEIRRYPAILVAETQYTNRPEGFDRIGSYCGGSNESKKRVNPYAPSIIQSDVQGDKKIMQWPISFAMPGQPAPTVGGVPNPGSVLPSVSLRPVPETVIAVRRFTDAATQQVVTTESQALIECIQKNGLQVDDEAKNRLCFAQYDAIFSMGDRRNEVWVPIENGHPWDAEHPPSQST